MRCRCFIILFAIIFLVSCGKKGDPTLKSFEKPQSVKEIRVIHRGDELIVSWQYPQSEREKIKGLYIEKSEIKAQESKVKGQGSRDVNLEFRNIAFLKNDETVFIDRDFKSGNKYFYKIRTLSLRNVFSNDSPVFEAAVAALPEPPYSVDYNIMPDSVEIRCDLSAEKNGIFYNIYKTYEKGKYGQLPLNPVPLMRCFYSDKPEAEKAVYYTVRALRNAPIKDEGFPSKEIEVRPSSFIPSKPAGLRFAPADDKVYLMWDENRESWVKKYRIYKRVHNTQAFTPIGESVTPAFADNTPLRAKTFYYITAVGPFAEGASSEIIEVNPAIER